MLVIMPMIEKQHFNNKHKVVCSSCYFINSRQCKLDKTTGCLLDYQYFKDHYQLIAVDLSKQKQLNANPRAIQQIEFYGKSATNSQVCTVLEKSKENVLEFYKGIAEVL